MTLASVRRRGYIAARRTWRLLPQRLRDKLWPLLFTAWQPVEYAPARRTRPETPRRRPDDSARVTSSVSVVMPVLDGGPELRRVLAAVRRQEGLPGLELVVVDSGSTDGSRAVATSLADRVIDVAPEEFGHGRTRNLAAEATSADVLVMLVQDAFLLGRHALRDLVAELEHDPHYAAVSARQIPRSDADLYGAFVVVAHERALEAARTRPRRGRWDPAALRALAGLDDVCSAIRREAWETLRFGDVDFAEDLDFGLRALARGWTIGRSTHAAVAHSHTRPPDYHLRRAVLDRLHVTARVGEPSLPLPPDASPDSVFAAGVELVMLLAHAAQRSDDNPPDLPATLDRAERALERGGAAGEPNGDLAALQQYLGRFAGVTSPSVNELLRDQLGSLLRWRHLREFASGRVASADETAAFLSRLAASVIGRVVGETLRIGDADPAALARL